MSIFEFISVAISIILGLSIARLLSAAIDLVSHRENVSLYWVPLTWALVMFSLLVIFWWQLFGANQFRDEWAFVDFVLAIACTVSMYIACGLILPRHWPDHRIDLYEYYLKDGRWGVAAYSLFYLLVIPYNVRLYGEMATVGVLTLNFSQAVLAGVAALSGSRRWIGIATLVFLLIYGRNLLVVIFPAFGSE